MNGESNRDVSKPYFSEQSSPEQSPAEQVPDAQPLEMRQRSAYNDCVRLLASRDHSVFELTRKLKQRDHAVDAIDGAITELKELNYVNEARYAQQYMQQRMDRGYGPLSVRAKLRERGIDARLVEQALAEQQLSSVELAQLALEKRFDTQLIQSRASKDEARVARFLKSRGFASSDALKALQLSRKNGA